MLWESKIYGCVRLASISLAVKIFELYIVYTSTKKPTFSLIPLVSKLYINIPNSHATEILHVAKELRYWHRHILIEYTYRTIDKC